MGGSSTKKVGSDGVYATDALERQLVPPGFECCERELLGRPGRRDWGMRNFRHFLPIGQKFPAGQKVPDSTLWELEDNHESR